MLKKIQKIKDLAVFKDFLWDNSVKDKVGRVQTLQHINILYGRNYSGKTTISRIFRSFETGSISSKYGTPSFTLEDDSGVLYTENDISSNNLNIRVFNEDFVRENLLFVNNPDEAINSFAVLGEGNAVLEKEINDLESELGVNEEGQKTGKYKDLEICLSASSQSEKAFKVSENTLNRMLETKATDTKAGIKYHSDKFGDQNYNITKLNADILSVQKDDYIPLQDKDVNENSQIVAEKELKVVDSTFIPIQYCLSGLITKTKLLVEQSVTKSEKILELVEDSIKNNWVREGVHIHNRDKDTCVFCGNEISKSRWDELDKHFDEKFQELTSSISSLITEIENEIKVIENFHKINSSLFYVSFSNRIADVNESFETANKDYLDSLNSLLTQLKDRLKDVFTEKIFISPMDNSSELTELWGKLECIRNDSNVYASALAKNKEKSQEKLRLHEVYTFIKTIDYASKLEDVNRQKEEYQTASVKVANVQKEIDAILDKIKAKRAMLQDEGNGATKVNEFLNNFFGNQYLSLFPIETGEDKKKVRFDVFRDGNKAYHLSEGEVSLLAFCYFLAKLEDINTKGTKPIIWIDDPISSLDGNHIFFVYSLLLSEIVKKEIFGQLFVSTHNLDFLKYLKRLCHKYVDQQGKEKDYCKIFLIVERVEKASTIKCMPEFLKEYASEFNYLFAQIYKCYKVDQVSDDNYTVFYNFGNNARKFLELYLFYRYPGELSEDTRFEKFFGKDNIPTILIDRLNNEYSHLKAQFERGNSPIDEPEMKQIAKLICETMQSKDPDQYASLEASINKSIT